MISSDAHNPLFTILPKTTNATPATRHLHSAAEVAATRAVAAAASVAEESVLKKEMLKKTFKNGQKPSIRSLARREHI